MPVTDEDIIRELLHRCTEHVRPAASVANAVTARQRRRDRRRALSLVAAGAALGTAAGVISLVPRHSPPAPAAPAASGKTKPAARPQPPLRLTADQRVLYQLSSVAARQAPGQGRYVVMSTEDTDLQDTTVIDSRTGDMWSYQKGTNGMPSGKGYTAGYSATAAQLAQIPTSPAALRAALIAEWNATLTTGIPQPAARKGQPAGPLPSPLQRPRTVLQSDDDKVFQQASYLLWNPLVSPSLRAALFRVLATVPGVQVNSSARDRLGRPAVELSRMDNSSLNSGKSDRQVFVTLQSPATGAVLESTVTYPPNSGIVTPQQPKGDSTVVIGTVYLSITWAGSVPANPYRG
jgi:hypothetical protein